MIYFLLLIISAVGTSGNFSLTKVYQKTVGTAIRESIVLNMYVGLFGAVVFLIINGFHIEFTPYSCLIALLLSLLIGTYTIIGFKIMSMGSMTVYTIFVMLGGAVVPYVYGILFLDERVNLAKIIALLLITVSVILNCVEKTPGKQSVKFLLLCIAVFFINGSTSILSKLHQIETEYRVVSTDSFVFLKNGMRFLLFSLLLPFCGRKTKEHRKIPKAMYFVMLCSAIVSSFANMLQLIGASNLPATMLYPVVTGGTVICTSLFDRLCFGQHLYKRTIISIIICIIALLLFLVK